MRNIWLADVTFEVLNKDLPLLVGSCVPTKVILVLNKDKPWYDNKYMLVLGVQQEAHLR